MESHPSGQARFIPRDEGPVLSVGVTERRRFLGRQQIARFSVSAAADSSDAALLHLRHTGRLRREGIEVSVVEGDEGASETARSIGSDPAFLDAVMPLDFTLFESRRGRGQWAVTVELMGATVVSMALPPVWSYVRLYPDQRAALIASLVRVTALLGAPNQAADGAG
jgi:hypothetical protein